MNAKEVRDQFEKYCYGDVEQYWDAKLNTYADKATRAAWEVYLRCAVINGLTDDTVIY